MTNRTTFRGKLDPYLTLNELRDLLNAAAQGRSSWTTRQVRDVLANAGALTTLPTGDDTLPAELFSNAELRDLVRKVLGHPRLLAHVRALATDYPTPPPAPGPGLGHRRPVARRTSRRQFVTTRTLLQSKLPHLYDAILVALPEEEFHQHLPEADHASV